MSALFIAVFGFESDTLFAVEGFSRAVALVGALTAGGGFLVDIRFLMLYSGIEDAATFQVRNPPPLFPLLAPDADWAHGVPAGDRVDTLAGCGGGGRDLGRLRVFVARHRGCAPRRTILSYALEGLQVAEMNLVPVGACFGVLATLSWEAIDACTHMHADAAVP